MARLNEPPVPPDNFEILRRRFLRQNRDIARINSSQGLKIRGLENECARLLSENLDLRGQVLRLEKELEERDLRDNSAQRLSNHAQELKGKMEEKLAELGSLLSSLGQEPPTKRRSSGERKLAKLKAVRSPTQRRRRDTGDIEALALQEGRLPPIHEHKPWQRATMNSDELLALFAQADNSADSPDLGPPPVSRYIEEEDRIIPESPLRIIRKADRVEERIEASPSRSPIPRESPTPKLDFERKSSPRTEMTKETSVLEPVKETEQQQKEAESPRKDQQPPTLSATTTVKAGAKRKFGDENDVIAEIDVKGQATNETEKPLTARDFQKKRNLKELNAGRRDKAGRSQRVPLSAKSTNDDMSSPVKKSAKTSATPVMDDIKMARAQETTKDLEKEKPSVTPTSPPQKLPIRRAEIPQLLPPSPSPPVVTEIPAPAHPCSEPETPLLPPDTPDRPPLRELVITSTVAPATHDTPPPADISSRGETSRPSRRNRGAISYAEPNLRDKMRRPTKELFDAVAGEGKGKFSSRSSLSVPKHEEGGPVSASKTRTERATSEEARGGGIAERDSERRKLAAAVNGSGGSERDRSNASTAAPQSPAAGQHARRQHRERHHGTASPLAAAQQQYHEEKKKMLEALAAQAASPDRLPSSVVTERRRRPSSYVEQPSLPSLAPVTTTASSISLSSGSSSAEQLPLPKASSTTSSSKSRRPTTTTPAVDANNADEAEEKKQQEQQQEQQRKQQRQRQVLADIYDFASSSSIMDDGDSAISTTDSKQSSSTTSGSSTSTASKPQRTARRASSAVTSYNEDTLASALNEALAKSSSKSRSSGSRKRASMVASSTNVKKQMMAMAENEDESSFASSKLGEDEDGGFEGDTEKTAAASAREKMSRRRSMML